jgi:transposase-like protein
VTVLNRHCCIEVKSVLAVHQAGTQGRPGTVPVYLYRAIDQYGQVIDVLVSQKRDLAATRRFFTRALEHIPFSAEVSADRAPAYPRVLDELLPSACHIVEQYANNPVEADHGRLKPGCGRCVVSNGCTQRE